jgi:hypothetical protein
LRTVVPLTDGTFLGEINFMAHADARCRPHVLL